MEADFDDRFGNQHRFENFKPGPESKSERRLYRVEFG